MWRRDLVLRSLCLLIMEYSPDESEEVTITEASDLVETANIVRAFDDHDFRSLADDLDVRGDLFTITMDTTNVIATKVREVISTASDTSKLRRLEPLWKHAV